MKCSTSNLARKMYFANIVLARDDVRKLQLRLNTQFLILIMDELAAECREIEAFEYCGPDIIFASDSPF
ncbi:hypothetical protein CY35_06G011700 [Sphagnum magellanicum]|jgi:hypothetical protein|nr:hypothetical protein CY35_06G011700 [Sphagnum magellanicum]